MNPFRRLVTGIDGLDLVLDGGFLHPTDGSLFLVILGGPGSGKTHWALELSLRILAQAERPRALGLYYGLDQEPGEIHAKLREDFGYYGVLESCTEVAGAVRSPHYRALLHRLAPKSAPSREHYLLTATLAEGPPPLRRPDELLRELDADVDNVTRAAGVGDSLEPCVLTIDNLSLATFEDAAEARSTLRALRQRLASRGTHAIFVVETPPEGADRAAYAAAEYAADVILQLGYHAFGDQFKERSLEISKARHQFYYRGTHHFSIAGRSGGALRGARGQLSPGLHVYPSIPTLLSWFQYHRTDEERRDDELDLGFGDLTVRRAASNGLVGAPADEAEMRRLALRFLRNANEQGLLISFQEPGENLLNQGETRPATTNAGQPLHVLSFEPEYLSSGKFLKDVHDRIEQIGRETGRIARVALVGLEHLRWGFPLLHDAKMLIPWLAVFFRNRGIASLFVETVENGPGGSLQQTAVSATVDNLLRVQSAASGGARLILERSRGAKGIEGAPAEHDA